MRQRKKQRWNKIEIMKTMKNLLLLEKSYRAAIAAISDRDIDELLNELDLEIEKIESIRKSGDVIDMELLRN